MQTIHSKLKKLNTYVEGSINRFQGKYRMGKTVLLREQNAIYFPIPKVACTSVLNMCADVLDIRSKDLSVHEIYFPGIQDLDKISYKYNDYFKFAFVRNPWDRLVSCFRNKIRDDSSLSNKWFENGVSRGLLCYGTFRPMMSFEEFVEAVLEIPDLEAEKHFRSQYTFLVDSNGEIIPNFFGKFENLNWDLMHVCERIGIHNPDLPHLQKSVRKNYRDYYSNELREKVRNRYSRDIELFGYTF
jgi:hypothetical protein